MTKPTEHDRRIAEEAGAELALRCRASGCPMVWSVNFGTKLCSAHALCQSSHEWPRVTALLLEEEAERARYGPAHRAEPQPLERDAALALLAEVREGRLFERARPRDWARRLQAAEATGASLSTYQRAAWRQAIGHVVLDAAQQGHAVSRTAIDEALAATGDLPI